MCENSSYIIYSIAHSFCPLRSADKTIECSVVFCYDCFLYL